MFGEGSGTTVKMERPKKVFYCVWEEVGCELNIKVFSKKKQTRRYRGQASGYQWGEGRGGAL